MEMNNIEAQRVESVLENVAEIEMRELSDLQLSLVGGGQGDVILG